MLFHCFLHCNFVLFVNNSLLVFPWWVLFVLLFLPWHWWFSTWNGAAMMRWPVLTWERRVHQISGFIYSNYHALWCRITLLYLLFSHNFFDLIKNSCYCSINVALLCHLYIYILTNSLFILSDGLPSPLSTGKQHITAACPRNQREKTNYYQRTTIICYGKISA